MTRSFLRRAVLAAALLTGATTTPSEAPSASAGVVTGASHPVLARAPTRSPAHAPGPDLPVLLVPGWFDTARDLAALRIRLLAAGRSEVEALTFADPTGSSRAHADEIHEAVKGLLERSGRDRVDVVAHSMGGLAVRWYLMTRPEAPVRRVAFIASPHRGTLSAHLAWGDGRAEMMPQSAFLDSLNRVAPAPTGVEAITIRTRLDTHVVPAESATLPGVDDHLVCCPTHAGLLRNEEVFHLVWSFLDTDGPP